MSSTLEIRNQKSDIVFSRGLHAFAVAFVFATFCLIVLGGTVTSHGVGLSVPDWPTSYHYNMFLFPPSLWTGGIFYEHTHRLLGSLVGLISIVVAILLWVTQAERPWLRWFGLATLVMVIAQGVMGGLRVTEISEVWGVFHGVTAQVFLCMTVVIAAATSRWWLAPEVAPSAAPVADPQTQPRTKGVRTLALLLLAAIFGQLILGAAVRHTGSGLAIPDFPSSYGRVLPPLDQASLDAAVARIPYDKVGGRGDVTPAQVGIHFAHRVWALGVILCVFWVVTRVMLAFPHERAIRRPALALVVLVLAQAALGASIIWTGRHPEVATAHQAVGAVILATAALLALRIQRSQYMLGPSGTASGACLQAQSAVSSDSPLASASRTTTDSAGVPAPLAVPLDFQGASA